MAIHELNLKTLFENLDGGRVSAAFQHELQRCIADCNDRPGEEKNRTVTLKFNVSPVCDESGLCEEIKGKFHVASSVPQRRSKVYSFQARKRAGQNQLVFNDMSDDNIAQKTIDE